MNIETHDVNLELINKNSKRIFTLVVPLDVYDNLENTAIKLNLNAEELLLRMFLESESFAQFFNQVDY